MPKRLVLTDVASFETTQIILVAGTSAAKNRCNADCSSAAAIDSVDFVLVAKDTVVPTVTFGHKNETTESIAATLEQSALHLFLAANVPATI